MTPYRTYVEARYAGKTNTVLSEDANLFSQLLPSGAIASPEMAIGVAQVYMREAFDPESIKEQLPLVAWLDTHTDEWVVESTVPERWIGRTYLVRLSRMDGRVTHINGPPNRKSNHPRQNSK